MKSPMLSGFQSGFLSIRPIGISFIISRTAVTASVTAHTLFGTGDGPPIKPEARFTPDRYIKSPVSPF